MTDKPKDDVVKHIKDFQKDADADAETEAGKARWLEAVANSIATDGDAVSLVMNDDGVMIYTSLSNAELHFLLSYAANMVILQASGTVH